MEISEQSVARGPSAFIDPAKLARLREKIHGPVVSSTDDSYDAARRVYNAMIDRFPAAIVRCSSPSDVIAAIHFARENSLEVAVRGGGHNAAGLGACDGGLVIDLSGMRAVQVEPIAQTVRVAGGCTWGELDRATHEFGLALPAGLISTTGVGGLTLGGGFGHLTRAFGLTIDSLLEAEVVLADGSQVKASPSEHPDLFWALRGGGGNFGVVTAFQFRLHPVKTVYAGPMFWPLEQAADAMRFYRDFLKDAPENLSGFFAFVTVPPGPPFPQNLHLQKMCAIVWCYCGPLEQAESIFRPIRQFRPPALDLVGPLPYPILQQMFDPSTPPGMQQYWRADFLQDLSDAAIDLHVKYAAQMPGLLSISHIYPINGAAHRVGKNATAFSYRDANWAHVIVGMDPDPAHNAEITSWARNYWLALHPYSAGGAYVNFLMDEGPGRVRATYRDNFERLVAVKRQYDPENFFHINQNISATT